MTQLEPTFTYQQAAEMLKVSYSLLQKEAAAGRLPAFREGRYMKVTLADLQTWREGQYARTANRRAVRVTRRDLSPAPRARNYTAKADPDILEALGLKEKAGV